MNKEVNIARPPEVYDAIVVGSGISGGWAAKELTEHGFKTLVLERGLPAEHRTSYVTEHKAPWEFDMRGRLNPQYVDETFPIQKRTGFIDATTHHFFFKDNQSRYIEEKPFTWVRGDRVGGKSIMWGRYTFRYSDLDFEANEKEGIAIDWPIRYKDIAPWYAHVERFAGISGEKLGLPHLPDGEFQHPMDLNFVEKNFREQVRKNYPERYVTIARAAVLTEPVGDRLPCHFCGPCWRGCSTGSYFSSLSSTLPAAAATGNLTLRPNSVVHSIIFDEATDRATGVRVVDRETKEMMEFYGKTVFLCGGTLGSTHILLNTKTPRYPTGLGNASGVLGHYLMDHHFKVGAYGDVPGFEEHYYYGNRPIGFYVPRYRNISDATKQNYLRGFGIEGEAFRPSWTRGLEMEGFGADFKQQLREPGPWMIWMTGFGETLPRYENHVRLSDTTVDSYGIPELIFSADWGSNEFAMRKDMADSMAEMLERCGLKNVHSYDDYQVGGIGAEMGLGIHEVGTARMGRDPKTSILNGNNQLHEVKNVFVTDGASLASSPCQNPSITFMALTARAVDFAAGEMKRGNL